MASKDNNSLVISLSVFVLLTVGLGVAWYMTWTHSTDLTRDLAAARKAESDSKGIITGLNQDLDALKGAIGRPEPDVDDIVNNAKLEIASRAGNGTTIPKSIQSAMIMSATERDANRATAEDKRTQLDTKTAELSDAFTKHKGEIQVRQKQVDDKEAQLLAQEKRHGEELKQREDQIDALNLKITSTETTFSNYRDEKEREIATLRDEISLQRDTLKKLRAAKFSLENLNFERPAGKIVFVEQTTGTASVDLGSRDQLRVGTTFSVYKQPNGGVGLSQSDKDIKGKLVITEILGPGLSRASIVDPKLGEPMAVGDPIYSPIFTPGRAMEIAVVGGLDFDGNPGSDREEFRRMVATNGASIILEVDDEAKVLGRDGQQISEADIYSSISSSTRFVLIGDLGDDNTRDTVQLEINNRIRAIKVKLEQAATDNGVYVLSLSRFLDYIGYSRRTLAWSQTRPFPATLPNGARSTSVNATFGSRQSSAVISGAFSGAPKRPLTSTGNTSGLYKNTRPQE